MSIPVLNAEFIMIEVEVTGSPLSAFTICMKGHPAADFSDMFSSANDYLDPKGLLRGAGTDMSTLNGKSWVMLDTRGVSDIALDVSSIGTSEVIVLVGG